MSLPQGYVCSLLHYSYFLSQVRPESVRVQTLRTVAVEGLVWVERWGLDTVQTTMDQSLQTHTQKKTRWKLYFSSSAFHVNDFNAKFLGLNAAHHKKPCRFNVSSCNFGPAVFTPPPFNSLAQHLSVGSMENRSVALIQPAHAKCSPRAQWESIGENKVKNDTLYLDSLQQRKSKLFDSKARISWLALPF